MTNSTNINLGKVLEVFNENHLWDDICVNVADDSQETTYAIFDGWDDHSKFMTKVREILELVDDEGEYEIEKLLEITFVFSDEYDTCSDCGNVIRTSADSYHWQPDFYLGDCFLACNKCFNDNEDYQEAYIEEKINSPKNAINGLISEEQLEKLGFEKWNKNSYESGLHYGQNDNPENIYEELSDKYEEIVFFVDGVGQFDTHFSVWIRGEYENEEA